MELRPIHKKESNTLKKLAPVFIGLFIIAIMVLSVLDLNKNNEDEASYNGYEFTRANGLWVTYINDQRLQLKYLPQDLENISADISYGNLLLAEKIYFSFDPENQALFPPANEFLGKKNLIGIAQQLTLACPYDNNACKSQNLPVKSCSDANDKTSVILMEYSNSTSIIMESNCLRISGTQEGITKVIEKLILKRFGII
ncbi:hypothetical protein J4231_01405 [Candidatus Woesearchaeota archaeon]|nr:hypothetical protein [Candidatus Woesearchaeota archaeon]